MENFKVLFLYIAVGPILLCKNKEGTYELN
jgi:hypothetical protein